MPAHLAAPPSGLVGWGIYLLGVLLPGRPSVRLLRLRVHRLQLRYLDWPLQRVALAVLTRTRRQRWWDRLPLELAPADQPVFFGGRADAGSALAAFRAGFYPMPEPWTARDRLKRTLLDVRGLPWHSPDPRSVIPAGEARVNKDLRRTLRSCGWTTTMDLAFDAVLDRCARPDSDNYWLTPAHQTMWRALFEAGHAHSLEVWANDELVGGLVGLRLGGVFYVASMFHSRPNAAKVADVDLNARLAEAGGVLVDGGGFFYPYQSALGARPMSRSEYVETLRETRDDATALPSGRLPVSRLLPQ